MRQNYKIIPKKLDTFSEIFYIFVAIYTLGFMSDRFQPYLEMLNCFLLQKPIKNSKMSISWAQFMYGESTDLVRTWYGRSPCKNKPRKTNDSR